MLFATERMPKGGEIKKEKGKKEKKKKANLQIYHSYEILSSETRNITEQRFTK